MKRFLKNITGKLYKMKLEIIKGSENYTCQVIKLPNKIPIKGLDNLVEVNHQGNSCLVGKDSNPDELYLFFPCESQISDEFLKANNLYRNSELNEDKTKKGFFEENRRVKAIKFKGIISSGFIIPLESLYSIETNNPSKLFGIDNFNIGMEFNIVEGIEICKKYIKHANRVAKGSTNLPKQDKVIFAPEHPDTAHLMKNIHKLSLNDTIAVTYKLHGTSARFYNTLVRRKLSLLERVSKYFGAKIQDKEYKFVCASRRVIKSVGGEEQENKQHYYNEDLWSKVGQEFLEGKLNQGECVYGEIIGKDYNGGAIQSGYSYGLNRPKLYIYRISNINSQGIEVDLSYEQMKERAIQLGVDTCPELFYGKLEDFLQENHAIAGANSMQLEDLLNNVFYNDLLEKPSILDKSVVEEGFCVRKDTCNKPEIYKVKSKQFILYEGKQLDKEVKDIEVEESINEST